MCFSATQNTLEEIQSKFSISELKANCETASETDEFRKVPKMLTDFYVLGHKTANLTEKNQKRT